jgi:hypothetical protein
MNRMDNLQIVFDRTDWAELAKQKQALVYAVHLGDQVDGKTLKGLLTWLDALLDAAHMDGFQTKETTR